MYNYKSVYIQHSSCSDTTGEARRHRTASPHTQGMRSTGYQQKFTKDTVNHMEAELRGVSRSRSPRTQDQEGERRECCCEHIIHAVVEERFCVFVNMIICYTYATNKVQVTDQ